jgi:hypothetical protein
LQNNVPEIRETLLRMGMMTQTEVGNRRHSESVEETAVI